MKVGEGEYGFLAIWVGLFHDHKLRGETINAKMAYHNGDLTTEASKTANEN